MTGKKNVFIDNNIIVQIFYLIRYQIKNKPCFYGISLDIIRIEDKNKQYYKNY